MVPPVTCGWYRRYVWSTGLFVGACGHFLPSFFFAECGVASAHVGAFEFEIPGGAGETLPDLTYHCSGSHWLAPGVAPAELRASMISKMRMLSAASAGVAGKSSRTGRSMLLNSSTFL